MRRTFTEIVLNYAGLNQAQLARKLGWSPARVNYLCSPECVGFPFEQQWYLKESLNLSDGEWVQIQREYFGQYRGTGAGKDVSGRSQRA